MLSFILGTSAAVTSIFTLIFAITSGAYSEKNRVGAPQQHANISNEGVAVAASLLSILFLALTILAVLFI